MTKLVVVDDPKLTCFCLVPAEHYARVLHTAYDTGNSRSIRIRKLEPLFGIELDRFLNIFCRTAPGIVAIAFDGVCGYSHRFFAAWQIHFGRINYKCR